MIDLRNCEAEEEAEEKEDYVAYDCDLPTTC